MPLMDLQFLGAATTVTGSQFLLTTGQARILIDCGMFQGSPNEAIRNRVPLAYDPREIDAILLTHAHLDHCGLIPHVVTEGFRGPIFATKGTVELATLVLQDSGKLQEEFVKRETRWEQRHPDRAAQEDREEERELEAAIALAEHGAAGGAGEHVATTIEPNGNDVAIQDPEAALRAAPPHVEVDLDEPLYTQGEAMAALPLFRGINYDEELDVAPGIHATFLDAGHILGSAIIRLRVADAPDGPERTVVFSGDLGRCGTPIIRDPTVLTDADYLFVESTYGGREHEPQDEAVRILAETVRIVAEHDGVLLVPSFAIGRTQEVVWQLDRLLSEGKIPGLPLYLDSPMASKASDVYRHHADYFDTQTRQLLLDEETPLDYPHQVVTTDAAQSQAITRAPRPYMIVASNGMLTGGRVVGHLRELIDDPSAVILFVGYQGEGTLGAHLQSGARTVRIDGQQRAVRCQVRSISGFSAHADESELLEWVGNFTSGKRPGDAGFPKRVFIVHGDPDAQKAIEPKIRALGLDTLVPYWRQRVSLD